MKSAALIALSMLAIAPLASAADKFWYVGAGAVESDLGFEALDNSATGWKVFGGYRFTRIIAAEAGYLDTGDAEQTIEGTDVTLNASGTHVSVVAAWPIGESFGSPCGRSGRPVGEVKNQHQLKSPIKLSPYDRM